MRIRIDDQFDDKTELEYDTVDNDSIIGNGVLGNDCSIIELKTLKKSKRRIMILYMKIISIMSLLKVEHL